MCDDLYEKETNENNLACLLYVISLVWVFPINSYYFLGFNFSTFCLILMILGACGFIVKGAISAYKGNMYKLPFAYRFIK